MKWQMFTGPFYQSRMFELFAEFIGLSVRRNSSLGLKPSGSVLLSAVLILLVVMSGQARGSTEATANSSGTTNTINIATHLNANPQLDQTTAVQNAIDSAPQGSQIYFPHGTYQVKDLKIPDNKVVVLIGRGATLQATKDAKSILTVNADIKRRVPLQIKGLRFDGRPAKDRVIGIQIQNRIGRTTYDKVRTNLHITDCSVVNCRTGIDLHAVLNCHIQDTVCTTNRVGLKLRQTKLGGCGNANLFTNVEIFNNQVGMLISGHGSKFPMANNTFTGGTIQNNRICGLAVFKSQNCTFVGTHFEKNTIGKDDQLRIINRNDYVEKSSGSVRRESENLIIKKANVYLNQAEWNAIAVGFSTPDKMNVLMENHSRFRVSNAHGFGNTQGIWCKDLDGTSRVFCNQVIDASGMSTARMESLPSRFNFNMRFAFISKPIQCVDTDLTNLTAKPNAPDFIAFDGSNNRRHREYDPDWGEVSSLKFKPEAGSTKSNRALFDAGMGEFLPGEKCVVSFLARVADGQSSTIRFELNSGTYAFINAPLTDRWCRVTMLAESRQKFSPNLYVYPKDETGPSVYLARIMTHKISPGESDQILFDIVSRGLFNPNTAGIQVNTDDDLVLDCNSKFRQVFDTPLTKNRTVTLPLYPRIGDSFEITRSDQGGFDLNVTFENKIVCTLGARQWSKIVFDQGRWHTMMRGDL